MKFLICEYCKRKIDQKIIFKHICKLPKKLPSKWGSKNDSSEELFAKSVIDIEQAIFESRLNIESSETNLEKSFFYLLRTQFVSSIREFQTSKVLN